jgi:hypothetical protein
VCERENLDKDKRMCVREGDREREILDKGRGCECEIYLTKRERERKMDR